MNSLLEENRRLDPTEAQKLWDLDLLTLGAAADQVRRRLNPGNRVTFVIDRNINYTNICISGCRFCAFYRPPGADDGYVLTGTSWRRSSSNSRTTAAAGSCSRAASTPNCRWGIIKIVEFIRGFGLSVHGFGSPPEIFLWPKTTLKPGRPAPAADGRGAKSHPRGRGWILVDRVRQQIRLKNARPPSGWRSWPRPTALLKIQRHDDASVIWRTGWNGSKHLVKWSRGRTGGSPPHPWATSGTHRRARPWCGWIWNPGHLRLALENVPDLQVSWGDPGTQGGPGGPEIRLMTSGSTHAGKKTWAATPGWGYRLNVARNHTRLLVR